MQKLDVKKIQFQLKQATDAVQRSAAATGNRLGGAQLSSLSGRANDVANQSFNGWLDRLQQMAQTGFDAQSNLSQAQNNLTTGRTNALQYGDTSALDVGMGKDVLGINKILTVFPLRQVIISTNRTTTKS